MKIYVKNNDVTKAFKLLTKKLKNEGVFKDLHMKRFAMSKSEKRKAKDKIAMVEFRKNEKKRILIKEKQEEWNRIEAKKRARKNKRQNNT